MKIQAVIAVIAGVAAAAPLAAPAQSYGVARELWDRPRTAESVLAQAGLRQAIAAWLAQDGRIVVRHSPRQDSVLQAEELRTWLIALAIEGGHVSLRADLPAGEPLQVELLRN